MCGVVRTILSAAVMGVLFASPAIAQGACSLLSKAEVKPFAPNPSVFDMIPPSEEPVGKGTSCGFPGIFIQIDPFAFSVIEAERKKPGEKFETVPGVGDAAYARENTRSDDAEIYFRVGQRVATIQLGIPVGSSYAAVKPRLIDLAKILAAKLK